jgi:hypothetical protein
MPAGNRWLLLLYEDSTFHPAPLAREPDRVAEYRAWAERIGAVDGAELDPGAWLIESDGSARPPEQVDPAWGRVAGYFVIGAAGPDQARAVAATCPHLKYRGRVILRALN